MMERTGMVIMVVMMLAVLVEVCLFLWAMFPYSLMIAFVYFLFYLWKKKSPTIR